MADSDDTSEVRTPAGVLSSSRGHELPDPGTSRELLRQMALIRRFEEEAGRQYQRAKAGGFLHLAIGEEATIVGTTSVMEPDDYLIGTYRTHGHAIARGTDPNNVMAELFGREDGTARGSDLSEGHGLGAERSRHRTQRSVPFQTARGTPPRLPSGPQS